MNTLLRKLKIKKGKNWKTVKVNITFRTVKPSKVYRYILRVWPQMRWKRIFNKIPEKEGGLHKSVHVRVLVEECLSPHQEGRYKADDIHQLPLVQQCLFLKYRNTSPVVAVWLLLECSYQCSLHGPICYPSFHNTKPQQLASKTFILVLIILCQFLPSS